MSAADTALIPARAATGLGRDQVHPPGTFGFRTYTPQHMRPRALSPVHRKPIRGPLAAALVGVLAAGCGLSAASPGPSADGSILAISTPLDGSSTVLGRLDADTLAPRPGSFDLGEYHGAWAFSPDRRILALGTFARTGLRLLDPVSLRLVRDVPMPIAAVGVGWVDPDRVAVLLQSGGVVLVDARRGRILRRWPLRYRTPCRGLHQAVTPHGVVFVVASPIKGRLRLLRVGRSGRLDVASLRRVRSPSGRRACGVPALAVDPAGGRALVAGSHGPAATVDLRSLHISYRPERHLAGPCRPAIRKCTARRNAVWSSTLALAGVKHVDRYGNRPREDALGLTLVNAKKWSSRLVDRTTGEVAAMRDGAWLAFGRRRLGIRAVTPAGATRWSALRSTSIMTAQATDHRVYTLDAAGNATVLDAATGRSLSTSAGRARVDVLNGRDETGDP